MFFENTSETLNRYFKYIRVMFTTFDALCCVCVMYMHECVYVSVCVRACVRACVCVYAYVHTCVAVGLY